MQLVSGGTFITPLSHWSFDELSSKTYLTCPSIFFWSLDISFFFFFLIHTPKNTPEEKKNKTRQTHQRKNLKMNLSWRIHLKQQVHVIAILLREKAFANQECYECSIKINYQTKPHMPSIFFQSRFQITFLLGNLSGVQLIWAMLRRRIVGMFFLENTSWLFCFLFFFIQLKALQGIKLQTSNNSSPKRRWLVVDIYSSNDYHMFRSKSSASCSEVDSKGCSAFE